ncbi:MAG: N-acetylmuramic acid 6-phosphate etherase [Pirellulaceae bacterium]
MIDSSGLGKLRTEESNSESERLDAMSPLEIVRLMNRQDHLVVEAVEAMQEVIARCIERIAERLSNGGRLVYTGAGTSGRLGVLDASECPPTFRTDPAMVVGVIAGGRDALTRAIEGAEDSPEEGAADLEELKVGAADVVVGIATSGRTPYVLGALQWARQQGACTIGIACNRESPMEPLVDEMVVLDVGPEILSGSTRLKSGTATKMVLNMLSTATMVQLGKTFGHWMVDLKPSNQKLRARSIRMIQLLGEVDAEKAEDLLDRCDGEVKTAVVAARANLPPEMARGRLRDAGGHLRRAIAGG